MIIFDEKKKKRKKKEKSCFVREEVFNISPSKLGTRLLAVKNPPP